MNELAEFNYNLQTRSLKMLHEQQYGIYGFHFPPPRSQGCTQPYTPWCPVTHTQLHTTLPIFQLLLPFAWLFQLDDKLIKIMERKVLVMEGSCFNSLVQNRRALVTLASNLHLEWGQERRTGTQNTKPGDTRPTWGTVTWKRGCCTQKLPAAQEPHGGGVGALSPKGGKASKYAGFQQRFQ